MIPILYDALEKDFTTNGIGFLTDAVSCIVTEERNGIYELALTYPTKGHLAKYLENDAIIKAKANDEDNPQLFRIYNHTKAVGENTTWYGEHISYELNGNPVDCFTVSEVNGERALHELLDAAILPHEFTCASDITTTNSTSIDGAVSVRNAMGGTEGSLLDVWGGEYHYDNYRVELLKARGVDNGVTIEYGKNLIDAKQEKNIADVVTVIFPYAKYTAEGAEQKTYITLPEKVLQHENANKYATLRCEIVDFSGEWESGTIITTDMLRAKAKEYLGKLSTEPKVNITLSFASLKKTKDYKNIKAFESVKLCDIVTVKILPLDINVKAKITKVKYDSIKERYESLEIGAARTNLTKTITAAQKEAQELIVKNQTRAEQIKKQIVQYKRLRRTVQFGEYYRLADPFTENQAAWNFVSEDGKQVIFSHVQILARSAYRIPTLRLRGLDPKAEYKNTETKEVFGGDELMYAGITIPRVRQDFSGTMIVFEKI